MYKNINNFLYDCLNYHCNYVIFINNFNLWYKLYWLHIHKSFFYFRKKPLGKLLRHVAWGQQAARMIYYLHYNKVWKKRASTTKFLQKYKVTVVRLKVKSFDICLHCVLYFFVYHNLSFSIHTLLLTKVVVYILTKF
jgi:hypothetical protein